MNYDVGKWNNQPLYNCRECPYDTLDEQAMQRHVEAHQAPPAPEEVQVVLLDRFGNVIGTDTVEVDALAPVKRPSKAKRAEDKQEVGDAEDNAH